MITFTVFGEPKGKARPRFTRNGRTYTDSKTVSYENLVRYAYLEACAWKQKIYKGNVEVCVKAYFSIPKSESKKKKEKMLSGEIRLKLFLSLRSSFQLEPLLLNQTSKSNHEYVLPL